MTLLETKDSQAGITQRLHVPGIITRTAYHGQYCLRRGLPTTFLRGPGSRMFQMFIEWYRFLSGLDNAEDTMQVIHFGMAIPNGLS